MVAHRATPLERGDEAVERRRGLVVLVVVQLLFGLFPLFVKYATDDAGGFAPRAIAVWRMACGGAVLGGLAFARHGRRALPEAGDLARLAACAVFGIVLNQVLAIEGMALASVVDVGLLMTMIPVCTYGLALLVRQEVFRAGRASGILVGLAGAAWLVVGRSEGDGAHSMLGNALIVANCFSYAIYLILARRLLRRYPTEVVIGWVFLLTVPTLPFLAMGVELFPAEVTPRAWWGMVYILAGPTVLAYLLNTFALARVSASTTAAFIYFQPLISGVAGVVVLGEVVGPTALVAAALLFAGVWLVTRSRA